MDAPDRGYSEQLPLAGAVLCCTSIAPDQRAALASIGAQMGATIKLDLTSDVTHLIVGNIDSAKYRYVAQSRDDVKVLSPTWLEALRQVWMGGDDNVNVAMLEKEHRLPTFFGLNICLTGFDNPEQRRYIQDTVEKNGAEYHGDLTKSVTHLIAATPAGKKYEHALNWRMKIVSFEWLEQSIERGMALDETLYNPTMRPEERGQGAWDRMHLPSPTLGKRTRTAIESQAANPLRRKLRRSASTKMGSQSEALWAGITAVSRDRQHVEEDDWIEGNPPNRDGSLFNMKSYPARPTLAGQPDAPTNPDPPHHANQRASSPKGDSPSGIFGGSIIVVHRFDKEKTQILRDHLESNGARVVHGNDLGNFPSDELRQGYVVVPHDTEVNLADLPDQAGSIMTLVTNWWVERCLYGKYPFDPADHLLSKPFDRLSISGFSNLVINSTGFVGIELLHMTKFVTLMGATYDEQLSAKTSVMVCGSRSPNPSKLKFAIDKRIPAVHVTWLWECLRTGITQPYHDYQLSTLAPGQLDKQGPTHSSLAEVPTAKLSEEDSFKLRQRKSHSAESATRPQREQGICRFNSALSAEATPASTTDPLTLPDNDIAGQGPDSPAPEISGLDGSASLPLQDVDANLSRHPLTAATSSKVAPRQRSSSAESLIESVAVIKKTRREIEPLEDPVIPAPAFAVTAESGSLAGEEKDYSHILAQLRANRKSVPTTTDQANEKWRRRRRQLGRATSIRSNHSTGESSGQMGFNVEDDEKTVLIDEFQPSQELGWDSPGAAKAREQMIKKLGGTVKERSVPVQGIGVVKDVVSESSGRVGRKRRI